MLRRGRRRWSGLAAAVSAPWHAGRRADPRPRRPTPADKQYSHLISQLNSIPAHLIFDLSNLSQERVKQIKKSYCLIL